jgi:hypothetical protein
MDDTAWPRRSGKAEGHEERDPMRGSIRAAFLVPLVLTPGLFAAGKVPLEIARARYVALGYDTGDRFLSEREALSQLDKILPEDQKALSGLRDQLESWDKYVITDRPEQAELLFAVRAGRRAVISGGTPLRGGAVSGPAGGISGGGAAGVSSYGGAQISSQGDMLTIYEARDGRPGTQLWRERHAAGFPSRLFEQFKADVERSVKKP